MSQSQHPIDVRALARQGFLAQHGYQAANLKALPVDASARRYFRLKDQGVLLMDAPPALEPLGPYVEVATLLTGFGLSAPKVLAFDEALGLALIEDFGHNTYTRLFSQGHAPEPLYELAIDALAALHQTPKEAGAVLPAYNEARLEDELALFIDWYVPEVLGRAPDSALRTAYLALFNGLCDEVAQRRETLVLRDFHVDNLMLLEGREGVRACGLLDFQDALHGAAAYDVMSLLEDARRDVPEALQASLLDRYFSQRPAINRAQFTADYVTLAAQRHAKVLGIFVRLAKRDGKFAYLTHLPRVLRLFIKALENPQLHSLRDFLDCHVPGWRLDLSTQALDALRTRTS